MNRNTNTLYILRFIAAVMVVLYHYSPSLIFEKLSFFINNGGEAVNFFFFISGFVMIITNVKYFNIKNEIFSKTDFYIKRLARIYPLYVFALIALALFHYGIKAIDTPTVKYRLPIELLGINRWLYFGSFNYPDWTISCEFFYYLFFPFCFFYMRKHFLKFKILVAVYFVLSIISTITLYHLKHLLLNNVEKRIIEALYLHPFFLFPIFLIGMLCGKMYYENKTTFFHNTRNNIVCIVLCILLIFFVKNNITGFGITSSGILTPVYFVFIIAITSLRNNQTLIFSSKLFLFLGEISYGIYILQYPVYTFYTYYITKISNGYNLSIFMLTLLIIASITHFLIEIPFKSLILNGYKKSLIKPLKNKLKHFS